MKYTKKEIEDAIGDMEGFVDITAVDVAELLARLEKNKRPPLKPQSRFTRAAKVRLVQLKRRFPTAAHALPKTVSTREIFYSWLFSFLGISLLGLLPLLKPSLFFIIGSFGASAVLAFAAPRSPLAQPRHILGGHFFSAIVGVCIHVLLPGPLWLSAALAVSTAIVVMHLTRTLHPPGGATALIAIIGGKQIYSLGFWYILSPVLLGACVILAVALVANNAVKGRRYPEYFF